MKKVIQNILEGLFVYVILSIFFLSGSHADTGAVEVQNFSVNNGVFSTDFTVDGVAHTYTAPSNTRLLSVFFGRNAGASSFTIQSGYWAGTYPFVIPTFVAYVYNEDTGNKEIYRYSSIDDSIYILNTELYTTTKAGYLRAKNGSYFTIGDSSFAHHYIYVLHPVNLNVNNSNYYDNTGSYTDNRIIFGSTIPEYSNYVGMVGDLVIEDTGTYTYIQSYGNIVSSPINLTQSFQSPDPLGTGSIPEEPLEHGKSVGKNQSGSGIILRANTLDDNPEDLELLVEVYQVPTLDVVASQTTSFTATGSGQVTIPNLGAGQYYWKAKVIDAHGNESEYRAFENDNFLEIDFEIYEGFEPYPYGYNFENNSLDISQLTGGIERVYQFFPYFDTYRIKNDGTKWDLFHRAFDTSNLEGDDRKLLATFESLGLNKNDPTTLKVGSCYGLSLSAAMQSNSNYTDYLQDYYDGIPSQINGNNIWGSITEPVLSSENRWNEFRPDIESIVALHLSQKSVKAQELLDGTSVRGANNVIDEILSHPNKTYILTFTGKKTDKNGKNQDLGHVVVPYKVEGDNIYVWDNETPYPEFEGEDSYNQFISIDKINNKWSFDSYDWDTFEEIILVDISDIYNLGKKSPAIGLNDTDTSINLSGKGDIIITDSQGRVSGFQHGLAIDEIPGVNVIIPLYSNIGDEAPESTFKQIYLPQKINDLTIQVIGQEDEEYDLMIAGGDYYTKLEGVSTSSGQIDTFVSSRTNLQIDLDDSKTGNYNLLIDNFYNSGTGTVYVDNVPSTIEPQQYTIDWTGVIENDASSVNYEIDTDGDGIYDTSTNLPPLFQDTIAPTTISTFIGTPTPDTLNSYMETVTIDLQAEDNTGGSGVKTLYYTLDNGTGAVFTPYTESIVVNGLGDYTLSYYAVDYFGNTEEIQTQNFSLTELPETYSGIISGYVYQDDNTNGVQDPEEKLMAGWKICIDENNNDTCEENTEPFIVTNNDGFYEFGSLQTGIYKILKIEKPNWQTTEPVTSDYYIINIANGEQSTDNNFGNKKLKGGKK